jgi:hypothetical protein
LNGLACAWNRPSQTALIGNELSTDALPFRPLLRVPVTGFKP